MGLFSTGNADWLLEGAMLFLPKVAFLLHFETFIVLLVLVYVAYCPGVVQITFSVQCSNSFSGLAIETHKRKSDRKAPQEAMELGCYSNLFFLTKVSILQYFKTLIRMAL